DLARAEAALTSADVVETLGTAASTALGEVVSSAKAARRAERGDVAAATALGEVVSSAKAARRAERGDEAAATALEVATAHLDNALLASRLPYFVDSD